jgi:hypothetical protein
MPRAIKEYKDCANYHSPFLTDNYALTIMTLYLCNAIRGQEHQSLFPRPPARSLIIYITSITQKVLVCGVWLVTAGAPEIIHYVKDALTRFLNVSI